MFNSKNYYTILEVSKTASQEAIKSNFKRLFVKHYTDKPYKSQQEKVRMEEIFKRINQAYETLNNPITRAQYDFKLAQAKEVKKNTEQAQKSADFILKEKLTSKKRKLNDREEALDEKEEKLEQKKKKLKRREKNLDKKETEISNKEVNFQSHVEKVKKFFNQEIKLADSKLKLQALDLDDRSKRLNEQEEKLKNEKSDLQLKETQLHQLEGDLYTREQKLEERENKLNQGEVALLSDKLLNKNNNFSEDFKDIQAYKAYVEFFSETTDQRNTEINNSQENQQIFSERVDKNTYSALKLEEKNVAKNEKPNFDYVTLVKQQKNSTSIKSSSGKH